MNLSILISLFPPIAIYKLIVLSIKFESRERRYVALGEHWGACGAWDYKTYNEYGDVEYIRAME